MTPHQREHYNYENVPEQKKPIVSAYKKAIKDASNKEFIIDDMLGLMDDDSILGKMQKEIAEKTIDAVVEYMESCLDHYIIYLIDASVS